MATQDEILAVLAATDIVDLIGSDIELRKSGKDYEAKCPFHDEKTPSFTVSPAKQFYHCFGCGAHGDAIQWMVDYHRLQFRQAIEELAGRSGVVLGQAIQGEVRAHRGKRAEAQVEEALHHELLVLCQAIGARVTYRAITADDKSRYPHIQAVSDDRLEREYEAARRITKGLAALYGALA